MESLLIKIVCEIGELFVRWKSGFGLFFLRDK